MRECPRAVLVATILQNGFQVSIFFCVIFTLPFEGNFTSSPQFFTYASIIAVYDSASCNIFYGKNIFYVRDSFIEWTSGKTKWKPGLGLFDSRMARNSIYVNTQWQILDDVYKRLFMNIFWIIELSSKIDKPAAKRSIKVEKCNFLKA